MINEIPRNKTLETKIPLCELYEEEDKIDVFRENISIKLDLFPSKYEV